MIWAQENPMKMRGCFGKLVGVLLALLTLAACDTEDPRVGSRDCDVLGDELCVECQGQPCTASDEPVTFSPSLGQGCWLFPCVEGKYVVQGCTADEHCQEFEGYFCGLGISMNKEMCGLDMGDY